MSAMIGIAEFAWRFRKPLGIALAVLALVAAIGGAILWHAHAVKAFGSERFDAGALAERGKWQAELAKLEAENRLRRDADAVKLRDIGTKLNDARSALREQRDASDQKFLEIEQQDEAAGAPRNDFDPRVLRIVR